MAAPTRLTLTEYVQRVLATVAVVGLALLLWRWLDVLLLAFGAVIVAVILRALADPIGRYARLNERVSLLVAVLVFLGLLVGGLWLFGSTIADQLYQLGQALPSAWAKIKPQLAGLPFGPQLLATVSGFETGASPDQATPLSEGVIAQIRGALVQLG